MEEQTKGGKKEEERDRKKKGKDKKRKAPQKELHLKVKKMLTKINIKKNHWKYKFNNILKVHFFTLF